MPSESEVYSTNFVYRSPVEPTQEYVVDVALVYGSVAPPAGQPTMRRWGGVPGMDGNRSGGKFGRSW